MEKIHSHISVHNSLAQDCILSGVFEEVNDELKELLRTGQIAPKPLLVCSGGTSSRCAANGHWTLDLRNSYQQINFDPVSKTIEFGAGNNMRSLLKNLAEFDRSFPTGLSTLPGIGYIITGGISPLSRSQGLAIDQVIEMQGIWGNGEAFKICKPNKSSSPEDQLIWRGLCGGAPFLGIITSLKLNTQPINSIEVWQTSLEKDELIELIQHAENWPNNISLQWIWGEKIKVFVVIAIDIYKNKKSLEQLKKDFQENKSIEISRIPGLHKMPDFRIENPCKQNHNKFHSEVISLLGPAWGLNSHHLIKSLTNLMSKRPNEGCFIAAQQLGGMSSQISRTSTSFIHRQAIWKPWITTSWEAGDQKAREQSLKWLEEVWMIFTPLCPGVHLAQMHQHLAWHQEETRRAFEEWLPDLQKLKSRYDPHGILPRL